MTDSGMRGEIVGPDGATIAYDVAGDGPPVNSLLLEARRSQPKSRQSRRIHWGKPALHTRSARPGL